MPFTPYNPSPHGVFTSQQGHFTPYVNPNAPQAKPVSVSPFSPSAPNSQFEQPTPAGATQMNYQNDPGTNAAGHIFSGTRDALGDIFVKPEQKLLADAGTRIAQAGVQTSNEFKNTGYSTPVDTGNPTRKNAGGKATPLPSPKQAPIANTINSEMNIAKPQQQLGVSVQPQQQGAQGAMQIGGQALNAVDAIGNVAMAGQLVDPAIKGLKNTGQAIVNTASKFDARMGGQATENAIKASEKQASDATWKMIQPELSKADLAKAVKSGDIATKGRLGTVTQIAKGRNAQMVEAANPFVSNAKDPIEAVSNMQQGIADEATKLRQGLQQSNATWSQTNLKGAINKVIKSSDNLVGDSAAAFKKTTNAVLQEAAKADKNLSGLLDVRQNFDQRVAAQYPNIYDSSNSAIKVAVTKTRSAINQMIEDALPNGQTIDGISFRDSLKKQSLLYDAIDNTAPKTGKLGTNRISQFMKNNPKTAKAIEYGGGAIVGGEILKHTGILP